MQSYKALSPIKIDTAEDAIYLMHEIKNDWSYDLSNPGKNFWYDCIMCNRRLKIQCCGRTNAAFCEKCWVFLQGYYWFAPTCFKDRPNPCELSQ